MDRRNVGALFVFLTICTWQHTLWAEDFRLFDRNVEVHGFGSQGLAYTDTNNWLSMDSNQGSAAYSDFAVNVSTSLTDKLRVGAQLYDRNLGELGKYHPVIDWAVVDYRFRSWFGIRGGKVKTTLGLYTDSQDLDFLHTFALLPQSVYPTDLRDATLAHLGTDVYGNFSLTHKLGDISYTAYAGHRNDSAYGGYIYFAAQYGLDYSRYGGLQYGADLRWNTPLKGLRVGISRLNEDITAQASSVNPSPFGPRTFPESDHSKADWTNQLYAKYAFRKLEIDSEYRRFLNFATYTSLGTLVLNNETDVHGWYVSGTYRVMNRVALGSYYSHYTVRSISWGPFAAYAPPDQTDPNLPANHIYDKVITARIDLKNYWNIKLEGHFMNGYGASTYPDGFYPRVNPQGFMPSTEALIVKTGVNF